jgi:hypothetical protein
MKSPALRGFFMRSLDARAGLAEGRRLRVVSGPQGRTSCRTLTVAY